MRGARFIRIAPFPTAFAIPTYASGQPTAGEAATSWGGFVTLAVVLLVLIVAIGAAIKLYDRKRRRDEEALTAQSFLTDVLLREFGPLPITASVTGARWWRRGPIVLAIRGTVATPDQREGIMRGAARELARQYPSAQLEDLLFVDPLIEKAHARQGAA
jgi:hypothetical protein